MIDKEFDPERVRQSIADINSVIRYTRGERVLPLQSLELEQNYVDAIARYFENTQRVLTEPGVVKFLQRSDVGAWKRDGAPHLVVLREGVHFISKGSYLQGNFPNITCLMIGLAPRLVYSTQETLYSQKIAAEVREDTMEQQMAKWQNDVKKVCRSADGHSDWVFGYGYRGTLKEYLYLYAYRTMGARDLLFPGNLPAFVDGISNTFSLLKYCAEQEVAIQFDGVEETDRIKVITKAFNQANVILERVLNPQAEATQVDTSKAKRGRKTPA